jgi:endo-1,4-beta-xylanase
MLRLFLVIFFWLGYSTQHLLLAETPLVVLTTTASPTENTENQDATADKSLIEMSQGLFQMGVGTGVNAFENERDMQLLLKQFSVITPENCLKPAAVEPQSGQFRFDEADKLMAFAKQHGKSVVGHCLVWAKDDRTPEWFYQDGDQPASRELLDQRMKTYIETVIGRYGKEIDQWDVVNEALDDDQPLWRASQWQEIYGGPEFIVKAFEYAHAADPSALLIYNDYRSELPGKREKMLELINYLKSSQAPIHAIGLQGHYELDDVPFEDLEITLNEIRKLGLKVVISEVDIDVVKRGRWWADGGIHREELASFDPYKVGCPPEILQRQADQYAKLFEIYARHADIIERVTFWNLHDGQSWLNYFPWNRANHPLLFDRQTNPKPAFYAVSQVLEKYKARIK